MNKEFEMLINTFGTSYGTCSLNNPKSNTITFVKNEKYINALINLKKFNNIVVLIPYGLEVNFGIGPNILCKVDNVDLVFTLYQNLVHKDFNPAEFDVVHKTANIHPSAVIGVDGIKIAIDGNNKILFKHTGNVIIEENVDISANVVIHRARLDSTLIKRGTIIGALTNIGHNVVIGEDCVLTTNISIGGTATIGNNCWIGMGAVIRNGINICDDVVIGMAAVVTKDITKPGFYAGNPARFLKKFNPEDRGF